jgi:hypothetical protein
VCGRLKSDVKRTEQSVCIREESVL